MHVDGQNVPKAIYTHCHRKLQYSIKYGYIVIIVSQCYKYGPRKFLPLTFLRRLYDTVLQCPSELQNDN